MEKEIWKEIPGYEDYEVSNLGKVKSFKQKKERILKPGLNKNTGYLAIVLNKNTKCKGYRIHQLVALAFLDHIPNRSTVVDHINGIKTDNRLENLRIVTIRENTSLGYLKKYTSSKYTGVSWNSKSNKWQARIRILNKNCALGLFNTEEEASEAYQKALKETKKA